MTPESAAELADQVFGAPELLAEFTVPIRTTTGLNAREHWAVRAKRVKRERAATWLSAVNAGVGRTMSRLAPLVITLTRISPRKCDSDAICGGCKGIRDEIANCLGIDDGDEAAATWQYRQERGPFGVRVTIARAP